MIRSKIAEKQYYHYLRAYNRNLIIPLENQLKKIITLTLNSLGVSVSFKSYSVLPESHFSKHILIRGITGVAIITKNLYIARNRIKHNYRQDPEFSKYTSFIYDYDGKSVLPTSILEFIFQKRGKFELGNSIKISKMNPTHVINPGKENKIYIKPESSFWHFYLQVVPCILQNHSRSSIFLTIDQKSTNIEVLNYLGLHAIPVSEVKITGFESLRIAHQRDLYPSKHEILFLHQYLQKLEYSSQPRVNVYISRKGNINGRSVVNEAELIAMLDKYSFICLDTDDLSFQEQVRLFSRVDLVIAPHGAALGHIVSFPKSAVLIELNNDHDVRWVFREMCITLNISHSIILGKSTKDNNFFVNIDLIESKIQSHLGFQE